MRKVDPARQSVAFYPSLEVALRLAWRLCCATLWKRTDASRHGFGARHSKRHRGETRAYVIPQIHFRKPRVVFRNRCRPSQTQPPPRRTSPGLCPEARSWGSLSWRGLRIIARSAPRTESRVARRGARQTQIENLRKQRPERRSKQVMTHLARPPPVPTRGLPSE